MLTRPATSASFLVVALLLVASLAISVPASCWCARDTHAGMLLHPLFPHHHGGANGDVVDDATDTSVSDVERASASVAPALTGPQGEAGWGSIGGSEILLPSLLAAALLFATPFRPGRTAVLDQHRAAPLTPPPRPVVPAL